MSEYCFLDWNAGWQAKRVLPSWLTQEAIAQIPKPKFVLSEVVSFSWSYGPLRGDVRHIEACVRCPWDILGVLPPERIGDCTTIYLTAYVNGHARWFPEDGAWRGVVE